MLVASSSVPPLVEPGPPLTREEIGRFSRHLLLPQVGEVGQRRLRNARVCVVGAGGLGAPVLLYLAAAGVGRLGIVDFDEVDVTNLQRQVIHGWSDVGRPKVDSARDAVHAVDEAVDVVLHPGRLTQDTVEEVIGGYDLVIDGTDNFPTRYLVNDACVRLGLPLVWGSIFRFDAQVSVFWGRPAAGSGVTPVQLRDLFPAPPPAGSVPSCAEGGVLGALCGQVGSVMATEAVKLITGAGEPLLGRVLVLDALAARWTEVPLVGDAVRAAAATPAVGDGARDVACATPVVEPVVEVLEVPSLTAAGLADRLVAREAGRDDFVLIDVRELGERAIVAIPGSRPVPLATILDGTGLADVPRDVPVVVHCRSGVRSAQAGSALRAAGYDEVAHLAGGVLAWVDQVDPSLPRY
ncbi:ThiF family adenylyltransferase [Actinotalea sp. K2]|uniref:ThiF family adenylyltransferase n=1 Tax=Actinotalea sp. K2 TaxID=2939438 RepID=UPI002017ECA1|nr:ThiF family adenylyltransferase [Actinotalea sp. K2]MCL3862781.1 ThiF family adenylyltransferase [Actinotalea sp. K2]